MYFQGSAIIRMMDFFLGEDTFQQGLTVSENKNEISFYLVQISLDETDL